MNPYLAKLRARDETHHPHGTLKTLKTYLVGRGPSRTQPVGRF